MWRTGTEKRPTIVEARSPYDEGMTDLTGRPRFLGKKIDCWG